MSSASETLRTMVARPLDGSRRVGLFQNAPAAPHWDDEGRAASADEPAAALTESGPLPG